MFVADDLAAWLIFILAEAGRTKLTSSFLGTAQERALQSAATAAIQLTAVELCPGNAEQAEDLTRVINEVFGQPGPTAPLVVQSTVLEALQARIAAQLAVLDDVGLTGTGQSSAQALGVSGTAVAARLTRNLLREVVSRGSRSGPLEPLANQLNHDVTHLQGRQIEAELGQLAGEVRKALAGLGGAHAAGADVVARLAAAPRNGREWPRVRELSALRAGVRRAGVWAAGDPLRGLAPDVAPSLAVQAAATYVPRRHDAELRWQLADAAACGSGLVWLVGRSCTGKTRSAWEAVAEGYQDWVFADCRDPAVLADLLGGEEAVDGNVIVWLDDIHLLDAPPGLARSLQTLFDHGGQSRILAIATSWPSRSEDNHEAEDDPGQDFQPGSAELGELQKLAAAIVHVQEDWDPGELARARAAAVQDPLLSAALKDQTFSPPQVLAGAKWAFDLWENPRYRETRALLTATIDLSGLLIGRWAEAPMLSESLLEECASCYLVRPAASPSWFKRSLREATTPCRDAVWALIPRGEQFQLFRPLLEYGGRARFWAPIPQGVWDALARARLDWTTLARLRNSAHDRMLYEVEAKFRHAQATAPAPPARPMPEPVRTVIPAPLGEAAARQQTPPVIIDLDDSDRDLADRLLEEGDIDGLRALAVPSNDGYIRRRLAMFYARQHDMQSLKDLATFSNRACRELAELLARDGDVQELLRQVVCGNGAARRALENWPIEGLQDTQRALILQNGLNADGTVACQPGNR